MKRGRKPLQDRNKSLMMQSYLNDVAAVVNRGGVCRRQWFDVRRHCMGFGEHGYRYSISIGILPVNLRHGMPEWEQVEFRAFSVHRAAGHVTPLPPSQPSRAFEFAYRPRPTELEEGRSTRAGGV